MLTFYWVCLWNVSTWNLKQWPLIPDVGSRWSSGVYFQEQLHRNCPYPWRILKWTQYKSSAHKMNTGSTNLRWLRLMSPQLLPRRQWITGQNCFYFLSFSVRNLKVYEQVNALKITLFKSISTSTRGKWPTSTSIKQPMPWSTTWRNLAFDHGNQRGMVEPETLCHRFLLAFLDLTVHNVQ